MASSPRVRKRSRVRRERHDRYRSGCGGAQAVEHYEMARYGALMHGPVTQHAESRGLAERKSTRGDEGGKVPDPRIGSPWTKEDVRELKGHSKARTPLSEI